MPQVGLASSREKDLSEGKMTIITKVQRKIKISNTPNRGSGVLLLELLLADPQSLQFVVGSRIRHQVVSVGRVGDVLKDLAFRKRGEI